MGFDSINDHQHSDADDGGSSISPDEIDHKGGPQWLSGDFEVIATPTSGPIDISFTNTGSFINTITAKKIPVFDLDNTPTADYAGIRVGFVTERLRNDTGGETTTVRAKVNSTSLTNCTASVTGGDAFDLPSTISDPIGTTDGTLRLQTEGKVTGGTGTHRGSIVFLILGEIA